MKLRFAVITMIALFTLDVAAQSSNQNISKLVRSSIYGQSIKTETGSWTFASGELVEIDIITTTQTGKQRLVVIAEIRSGDEPGVVFTRNGINQLSTRIEGRLRLTFDRDVLTKIENISVEMIRRPVEFRDIGRTNADASLPYQQIILLNEAFHMPASTKKWFPFTVNRTARITGSFYAEGGGRNDIEGFIMSDVELINWRNNNQFRSFYSSGSVTIGTIDVVLAPGNYVIAFRNGAWLENKTVKVSLLAQ